VTHNDVCTLQKEKKNMLGERGREARSRSRLEINKGVEDKPSLNMD